MYPCHIIVALWLSSVYATCHIIVALWHSSVYATVNWVSIGSGIGLLPVMVVNINVQSFGLMCPMKTQSGQIKNQNLTRQNVIQN